MHKFEPLLEGLPSPGVTQFVGFTWLTSKSRFPPPAALIILIGQHYSENLLDISSTKKHLPRSMFYISFSIYTRCTTDY